LATLHGALRFRRLRIGQWDRRCVTAAVALVGSKRITGMKSSVCSSEIAPKIPMTSGPVSRKAGLPFEKSTRISKLRRRDAEPGHRHRPGKQAAVGSDYLKGTPIAEAKFA